MFVGSLEICQIIPDGIDEYFMKPCVWCEMNDGSKSKKANLILVLC